MVRTILKPTKNNLTLKLPDYLIGKIIEVIAFEIKPTLDIKSDEDKENRIKSISEGLNKYRTDLSGFKFNRDEANDYD